MDRRNEKLSGVDDKIEMLEEENAKIEQQIAIIVENYQVYEQEIFKSVSPEDAVTMVSLFPELKSDTLVVAQIETYVANRNTIIALKAQQLNAPVYKWWLYFGR